MLLMLIDIYIYTLFLAMFFAANLPEALHSKSASPTRAEPCYNGISWEAGGRRG